MSLAASFAALFQSTVLVDCDVDAADLYLLLEPQIKEENEVISGIVDDDPEKAVLDYIKGTLSVGENICGH